MQFNHKDVLYGLADGVATITLNRPESLNSLSDDMTTGVLEAIEDAKVNDAVRAVVITGAGRGFCSGRNVRDAERRESEERTLGRLVRSRKWLEHSIQRIPRALQTLDKPFIAAVNGPAVGAGMDLASMADIRFASDQAKFGQGYSRMGLVSGNGGAYFLPRIVGVARACELLWTSRLFDAQEALQLGYVSRVVPHGELMERTREFAQELAQGPGVSIQLFKRLIYRGLDTDLDTALTMAQQAMLLAQATDDAVEGPRSFVEKRQPRFQGQ
ncbi:MAG: enoyl-CoA hydratase/isomerase family protein [Chloroflexi bacterium]|nr:enoyl-CoA hydratase/isomerase family protein [Chloroflexota bacterium]